MSEEAFIHARWHRALDDLSAEPDGPIRDHIEQHDARVRRDLAAKVEALAEDIERQARVCNVGNSAMIAKRIRDLLADAQTPATSHAAGAGAANGASADDGAEMDVAGGREAHSGSEVCSTCGQSFDSPPCCTSPFGMSGHTVAGGPMSAETRDGGAGL